MQRWQYQGLVTETIDHPERGPMVIWPRQVFEAPGTSVATLVARGLVVPARPEPVRRGRRTVERVVEVGGPVADVEEIPLVLQEPTKTKKRRPRAKAVVDSSVPEAPAEVADDSGDPVVEDREEQETDTPLPSPEGDDGRGDY